MKLNLQTKKLLLKWLKSKDKDNYATIYIKELTKLSEGIDEKTFNRIIKNSLNDTSCKSLTAWRKLLLHYKTKYN